ncbi:unnamed protein product, partial [Dracunculus medinensis]|uniref:Dol-P-Glc:Glc(2)Man(9)GlcNAc(2)-PP-Dol alpha-1,2-glucosyltransferase n=1 Tax=Dracunculus medinensis TaxID=318479 RepID=A0A0N4UET2_DRAME
IILTVVINIAFAFKWILGSILGLVHACFVHFSYLKVSMPYMDEIFHVDQTRRYCIANYSWNGKITTPPALYLLSVPFFCGNERYINSFLICFAFVGLCNYRRLFTSSQVFLTSILSLCLPVLFHSSILYYTDLLSLTTLLWALSSKSSLKAAIFFTLALLTRQTNIIWAGMYVLIYFIKNVDDKNLIGSIIKIFLDLWSFILLFIAFMSFVIMNDGKIVLGDHEAHRIVPHFMQLYYFSLFVLIRKILFMPIRTFVLCGVITVCIYCFTMDHPYLLADNRHYTFYIWRRFFLYHPSFKYLLMPIYLISLYIMKEFTVHLSPSNILLFLLSTASVLVPAHLLEPRYFIASFILWRMALLENRRWVLIIEFLYLLIINSLTLYLFFEKPFEWLNEPGIKQRFMW